MRSSSSIIVMRATAAALLAACVEPALPGARTTEPLGPENAVADVTVAATLAPTWVNQPGGVSVAVDAANQAFTARWDYNPAGDIYVAKRSSAGALQWEVKYDNTDQTRHEVATWVATDPAGNVFVSGTIRSGYSNPVNANSLLMKFSSSGALLWRRVYGTPFDGSSTRRVVVDGAGNAYVLGIGSTPTGQRMTIRKFDPAGTTVWSWFDPLVVGGPINLKLAPDGSLLVAARAITGSANGYAKVSPAGTTTWRWFTNSISLGDLAGDAAGNAYLVNGAYSTGSGSLLRKVGPTGALLWERTMTMTGLRVDVGPDHAPVVSGYPNSGFFGAAFTKFDSNGALLWTNLDADGPSLALLAHAQMRLDAAGDAYLAAGDMSQMGVVKVVGATGASAWTSLISFGYGVDLALGTGGAVFVVGGTTARLDQQVNPPTNTAPVVTLTAPSGTTIPRNRPLTMTAAFTDPDVGDGPWTWKWRWGNGPVTGTWAAPGTYSASRTYFTAGTYNVSVIVTDARGGVDTSNVVRITVQ